MRRKPPRPDRGQLQAEFIVANAWLFRDPGKQPTRATETPMPTLFDGQDTTLNIAAQPQRAQGDDADLT